MSELQQYLDECVARRVSDVSGLRLHRQWMEAAQPLPHAERDELAREGKAEEYRVHRTCIEIVQRKACVRCWIQRHCCICTRKTQAQPAHADAAPPSSLSPHRLVLLMHHTEYGRASNTGKLLLLLAPPPASPAPLSPSITFQPSSPLSDRLLSPSPSITPHYPVLLIDGIPAHNEALQRLCDEDPDGRRTFVLFPSKDAVDLDQWKATRAAAAATATPDGPAAAGQTASGYTVIVVDGTYSQAATLVKRVPAHIRRVKLPSDSTNPALAAYTADVQRKVEAYQQRQRDSHADDLHRVGKQWSAPPPSDAAAAPFTSFFTALRKQPQADRVSTLEAVVLCLQRLDGVLRTNWLDGLLVLVDAMRLQVGMYQMYGQFSEGEVEAIKEARRRMYSTEVQQEAARKRQRSEGQEGRQKQQKGRATLCRAFNSPLGCQREVCARLHSCSACAQPHPLHTCQLTADTAQHAPADQQPG